jgi:hypothetical protein
MDNEVGNLVLVDNLVLVVNLDLVVHQAGILVLLIPNLKMLNKLKIISLI